MAREPILNHDTAISLLRPSLNGPLAGDVRDRWCNNDFKSFKIPFLRIRDRCSGNQPEADGCMKARASRQRLDTSESRKSTLAIHINHKDWTPTPYISFQTSPAAIETLAKFRGTGKRGRQILTVVDPNKRIADGLPILDVGIEMGYYGVDDPYGYTNQYYTNHYLCLWEVTEPEIISC